MIRPILRRGAVVLHQRAAPVDFVTQDLQRLIDDMIETMHAAPGIGLAAPQLGIGLRVFVIDLSVGQRASELKVMINPRLVDSSGLQFRDEGCLSVPGFTARVARPRRAVVHGLDRDGREHQVEGTALLARALQHEMDHLDGRLYLERVGRLRRWVLSRRISFRERHGRW
jgi:peptide deformylase